MPQRVTVVDADALGPRSPIARGAQAQIYTLDRFRLPDTTAPLAYKEYFQSTPMHLAGLESIVSKRSTLSPAEQQHLDGFAAWPLAIVQRTGRTIGIVMQLISSPFTFQLQLAGSGVTESAPCKLQYAFIDPDRARRLGAPQADAGTRLQLIRRFAEALGFLHHRGIVFGDISANNALYAVDAGTPRVMLIDCDAIRMIGSAPVVPQLNSPDWDPPECADGVGDQTKATDVYKFGLLALRLLLPGDQGSIRRDIPGAVPHLTPEQQQLLQRSLGSLPDQRPSMDEWLTALAEAPPVTPTDAAGQNDDVGGYRRQPGGGWVKVTQPDARPARPAPTTADGHDHPGWVRSPTEGWTRRDP